MLRKVDELGRLVIHKEITLIIYKMEGYGVFNAEMLVSTELFLIFVCIVMTHCYDLNGTEHSCFAPMLLRLISFYNIFVIGFLSILLHSQNIFFKQTAYIGMIGLILPLHSFSIDKLLAKPYNQNIKNKRVVKFMQGKKIQVTYIRCICSMRKKIKTISKKQISRKIRLIDGDGITIVFFFAILVTVSLTTIDTKFLHYTGYLTIILLFFEARKIVLKGFSSVISNALIQLILPFCIFIVIISEMPNLQPIGELIILTVCYSVVSVFMSVVADYETAKMVNTTFNTILICTSTIVAYIITSAKYNSGLQQWLSEQVARNNFSVSTFNNIFDFLESETFMLFAPVGVLFAITNYTTEVTEYLLKKYPTELN